VNANLHAATKQLDEYGLVMNIACHERISLNELIGELNKVLGKNIKPIYESARPGDVKHSFAAIDHIKKFLNYTPNILFYEGLSLITDKDFIS